MTGPAHYLAAEGILNDALKLAADGADMAETIAVAQVHATLALAAATALGHIVEGGPLGADRYAWICAASEHPGQQQRIREAEPAEFEEAQR